MRWSRRQPKGVRVIEPTTLPKSALSAELERPAGDFATRIYRDATKRRRRKILRQVAPPFVALAVVQVGIAVLVETQAAWYLATFLLGAVTTALYCIWVVEPKHVQSWWQGAEGERATEAELSKLADGWTWRNGIELGKGDIDHLVSGPAGTFVLETKYLTGTIAVRDAQLERTYDELPDRPESWSWVRWATIRKAIEVSSWSAEGGGRREFVCAVVVLWGDFDQGLVEEEHITYVHGSRLAEWLASRPRRRGRAERAA